MPDSTPRHDETSLLRERARKLAQTRAQKRGQERGQERTRAADSAQATASSRVERVEAVFFTLADQVFAVEARFLAGLARRPLITPLPGTPAFFQGLALWEGRVLGCNDLAMLLDLAAPQAGPNTGEAAGQAVWLLARGPDPLRPELELALAVGQCLGPGALDRAILPGGGAWREPPRGGGRLGACRVAVTGAEHCHGLSRPPGLTQVLDLAILLADPVLRLD